MNQRVIVFSIFVVILGGMATFWVLNPPDADNSQKLASPPEITAQTNPEQTATQPVITRPTSAKVGDRRPDFSLPDFDGQMRSISEFDGQVVLLNFWASWCPPCVREMPAFIELQEEYGEQGFQVVGVAVDSVDAAQSFADGIGADYPMMHGQQEAVELSKTYGNRLSTLPYNVLIDRSGTIQQVIFGELHKDEAIKMLTPLL